MEDLGKLIIVIVVSIIIGILMAFPVMWLWNDSLVPAVTWAKPIDWSTAWGIWILLYILSGSRVTDSK
jgi:predicted transglutaminase-like protease